MKLPRGQAIGTVSAALLLCLSTLSQTASAQVAPLPADAGGNAVAALDSIMAAAMKRHGIAGGAYVLVSAGRIVASKGFGVADLATGRRVHPDSTVFGLASTTKLFTAIAAARLARDGGFDLDAVVAPYLEKTQLSGRANNVTLSKLLTHTAGFDDPTIGSAARSPNGLLPLDTYLNRSLTEPWIRPGTHTSYSNVGVALAGYVLSRASGTPFEALLDSMVFLPFGMTTTTVRQPLPAAMESARAISYSASGDRQNEVTRIYFNDAPASAAYSTPHDMGILMERLLVPASSADSALVRTLLARRFTNHPALPGMTLGFRESPGGAGIFEHGGDWQDYSNSLYIDTQTRTGLFAVFSTGESGQTAADLWTTVQSELPARPNPYTFSRSASASNPGRCSTVAGTYRDTRMSRHTLAKLGILTGDVREVSVSAAPSGIVIVGRSYQEMGGGVFQSDSGRTVAFRCENAGEASHLFFGRAPSSTYRRVSTGESRGAQGGLLMVALIATIAAVVTDVKRRRIRQDVSDNIARGLRIIVGLAAVLLFFGMILLLVSTNPWDFQYGVPANITTMVAIGRFIAAGAAVALVVSLVAMVRPRAASGILEAMLCIPVVMLVVLMVQWELVVM